MGGVTVQVDQHVEPVPGDLLRGALVVRIQLHEAVGRGPGLLAPLVVGGRAAGVQHDLASAAIVGGDCLQYQEGHRMGAEIR